MRSAGQAGSLLDLARDSLDDAKVLARRGRRNASLLLDLALRQALSAISVAEGLDVSDTLGLETLLRRVPAVHPEAALVRTLSDPDARTQETVGQLIGALSAPPKRPARPKKSRRAEPKTPKADPPRGRGQIQDGPTAFDASPHGDPRPAAEPSATSAAFWALMDRWRIDDLDALALIGRQGGLTKKGTRPRFRLTGQEARRYASLRRIDAALELLDLSADWLLGRQTAKPFDGRTPLAVMIAEPDRGAGGTIQLLNRQGLRSALASSE